MANLLITGDKRLKPLKIRIKKVEELYNELIMAVETKHEGETRHQTALRYIKACEMITDFQAKTAELQKQSKANQPLI